MSWAICVPPDSICVSCNTRIELAFAVNVVLSGRVALFRTRAAAYRDGCLNWGGLSFTTARPLVPAMCLVKNVFPRDSKITSQRIRRGDRSPFLEKAKLLFARNSR